MLSQRTKPSFTSFVAFVLIVSPVVYVLSYAPVVHFCGEETMQFAPDPDIPFHRGFAMEIPEFKPRVDGSRFPPYKPVDWLIDNTAIRKPLFIWAGLWGSRDAFEYAGRVRHIAGLPRHEFSIGPPLPRDEGISLPALDSRIVGPGFLKLHTDSSFLYLSLEFKHPSNYSCVVRVSVDGFDANGAKVYSGSQMLRDPVGRMYEAGLVNPDQTVQMGSFLLPVASLREVNTLLEIPRSVFDSVHRLDVTIEELTDG